MLAVLIVQAPQVLTKLTGSLVYRPICVRAQLAMVMRRNQGILTLGCTLLSVIKSAVIITFCEHITYCIAVVSLTLRTAGGCAVLFALRTFLPVRLELIVYLVELRQGTR
jgi:hypothetical protein